MPGGDRYGWLFASDRNIGIFLIADLRVEFIPFFQDPEIGGSYVGRESDSGIVGEEGDRLVGL